MYKIGKVTLSQQALTAFILGIIMFVLTLVTFRRSKKGMGIAFGYLLATFYNTYMINCLVVGECKELAWVLVVLMSLAVVFTTFTFRKLA